MDISLKVFLIQYVILFCLKYIILFVINDYMNYINL